MNITEFRRLDVLTPAVEPSGKILLGPNEVPVVPEPSLNPAYSKGIVVVITNQGGV
ncbi:MAG: hypothetical protein ABTS22_22895 [Accumulibacter sp.]|uniref:hypothetical protein n=1 Tax=Accumulibacter sp. TaxID=2053492 RepID=UPI00331493D1